MDDTAIPTHRREVKHRSAEPVIIAGGPAETRAAKKTGAGAVSDGGGATDNRVLPADEHDLRDMSA
jgi:hypothetical protein